MGYMTYRETSEERLARNFGIAQRTETFDRDGLDSVQHICASIRVLINRQSREY